MKPFFAATTATIAMIAAAPVLAQDGSAETGDPTGEADDRTIVITGTLTDFGATKSDTPIVETARSISIETEQDFEEKGAQSLDDALTYSAGVTAEPFGFSTRGDFAQVRGLDAPEYRDNLQYLFGFYNTTRQDLYTLEQIEVLKGPASVLYGAGSPGGIINVVTKRPHGVTEGEVRFEYGSFNRKQIATDINIAIPGAEEEAQFRFVGLLRDADTQIDEVGDEKFVLAPALTLRPGLGTEVTILANYPARRFSVSAASQRQTLTARLYFSRAGGAGYHLRRGRGGAGYMVLATRCRPNPPAHRAGSRTARWLCALPAPG